METRCTHILFNHVLHICPCYSVYIVQYDTERYVQSTNNEREKAIGPCVCREREILVDSLQYHTLTECEAASTTDPSCTGRVMRVEIGTGTVQYAQTRVHMRVHERVRK